MSRNFEGPTLIEWMIGATILGILAALLTPLAFDWMAFDAMADCRAKQMEPLRRAMTTQVRCVPIAPRGAGRDTVNLKIEKP